jgi:hypothetical protein
LSLPPLLLIFHHRDQLLLSFQLVWPPLSFFFSLVIVIPTFFTRTGWCWWVSVIIIKVCPLYTCLSIKI